MVRVIFDGTTLSLANINVPGQAQTGDGGPISYFEPHHALQRGYGQFSARQRGAGVGSMLRNIWHYLKPIALSVKPIAASVAREIGREGLATTARTLDSVAKGANLGEAISENAKTAVQNLAEKAATGLKQRGKGRGQTGAGNRRKRSASKRGGKSAKQFGAVILKPGSTVPARAILKKRRLDSLGYY